METLLILVVAGCIVYMIAKISKTKSTQVLKTPESQLPAFAGALNFPIMLTFEGVTLQNMSSHKITDNKTHTYDTGNYSGDGFGGLIKQTGSYTTRSHRYYIQFMCKNDNPNHVDILLRCNRFEETRRREDGSYLGVYEDTPETRRMRLTPGEVERVVLNLHESKLNRTINLVSIFVKDSSDSEWKEHKVDICIKK